MGTYVDLDGVRTWYEEHGRGEPLVALHPGLADARSLAATVEVLAATSASTRRRAAGRPDAPLRRWRRGRRAPP